MRALQTSAGLVQADAQRYACGDVCRGKLTMTLEWKDADDVVARVGEAYMIKLFAKSGVGASVRFGLTVNGTSPNYQVEFNDPDRILLFSGRSHKEWTGDETEFDRGRISTPMPYDKLYEAFLRRFRKECTSPAKR